jgi:hypothetical protein
MASLRMVSLLSKYAVPIRVGIARFYHNSREHEPSNGLDLCRGSARPVDQ